MLGMHARKIRKHAICIGARGLDRTLTINPVNDPVASKFEFPVKPIAVVGGRPPDSAKLMPHLMHEDQPKLLQSEHLWQRRAGASATWIDESRSCRLHAIGRGDDAMGGKPARPAPNTRPTRKVKLCAEDRSPVYCVVGGQKIPLQRAVAISLDLQRAQSGFGLHQGATENAHAVWKKAWRRRSASTDCVCRRNCAPPHEAPVRSNRRSTRSRLSAEM